MSSLDSLRADTVLALRRLRKSKVTSGAAILSLALAIGSCISAFRLIDALLLRPLPIAHPERLYALSRKPTNYGGWDYPTFRQMRAAVADQADLIAISYAERVGLMFQWDQEMEKAHVQYVSGSMFGSFGLRPALGRLLTGNDDLTPGAHPVAVLSHDYWSRRFAADPKTIGRTFRLGNVVYEIVGVAGAGFTGTEPGTVVDIFMPAMMHWGLTHDTWALFRSFVHLHPGVAAEPVRNRLSVTFRALSMEPAAAGVSGMQANYRLSLTALGILVALVLLIACANLANLTTAQAAARAREMALRVSIGAARSRLVQLVLVESALIALFAVAIGAWFAQWSAPFVVSRINAPDNPARLSLATDWRVLAFGLAMTIGVTFLFGLAPALRASAVDPVSALKGGEDPHARRRWMRTLIAVQAGFCFLVLFVAGLFVATFNRLSTQPTGFSAERLLTLDIATPRNEPMPLWDQVTEHLRKVPGVATIALADWPLLDGYSFKLDSLSINGAPPGDTPAWFLNVSPGWLSAMRIPLIDGRDFRANDISPGVAIVNQTFVRQYFNGENPIGKWFEGTSGYMQGQRFQIVGLASDARYRYIRQPILAVAYTPFHRLDSKGTMLGGTIIVRSSGANVLTLAPVLRREVSRANPEFRVRNIRTQADLIESQTVRERLLAMLALFFAAVALLLAGVGLYGVLNYSVLQRRREIGIRLALGAQAGDIARRVTAEVFAMVLAGAVAGVAGGLFSVRYLESLLYQVHATDPGILAAPSLAILSAALVAAAPAVLHAVRIDPVSVMRSE